MPVPTSACAEAIGSDVACDTTWLIGERIRTVAFSGVCGCNCSQPFRSFTSIGTIIQDPLGDSLIIAMISLGAAATTGRGATLPAVTHVAQFRLELRDNGWPVVQRDESERVISFPDSSLVNAVSKHAQSHGEMMYRSIVNAVQMHTLFAGSANGHVIAESIGVSPIVPINPSGGQVGWGINVNVPLRL